MTKSSHNQLFEDGKPRLDDMEGNRKSDTHKLYPIRWAIQISFTLGLMANGFIMVGFSPIADMVARYFSCDSMLVQIQTLIFLICFVPGNFIVIKVLAKYGLRICVLILSFKHHCFPLVLPSCGSHDSRSLAPRDHGVIRYIRSGFCRYNPLRFRTSFLYQHLK